MMLMCMQEQVGMVIYTENLVLMPTVKTFTKMKFGLLFLFVAVLLSVAFGYPSKGSTKPSLKKKCLKDCGSEFAPVCGGDGSGKNNKSFGSQCVLENYNCENSANLRVVSKGECPGGQGIRLS